MLGGAPIYKPRKGGGGGGPGGQMPLKRRAKRREECLLNQDDELESSQIRYDADAEQRRASARAMYRANLELLSLLRGGDRKRILLRCKFLL